MVHESSILIDYGNRFFGVTLLQAYNYYARFPKDWMVHRVSVCQMLFDVIKLAHFIKGWSHVVGGSSDH